MDGRKKPEPNRVQEFGSRRGHNLGASAVATVWIGYILAGVAIGYLLDSYFHTSYWIPILLMVGAIAGFRDMIQTLNRVAQREKNERAAKQAQAPGETSPSWIESDTAPPQAIEAERPKPRIFAVPPPPQSSFAQVNREPVQEPAPANTDESDSPTDLIKKLASDDQTSSQ